MLILFFGPGRKQKMKCDLETMVRSDDMHILRMMTVHSENFDRTPYLD